MELWREKLKDKPLRYWIRIEIEEIVKKKSIDRTHFYEYSKTGYSKVINRFYYAFADYEKYPKVHLEYCWMHLRKDLKILYSVLEGIGWKQMLSKIKEFVPGTGKKKVFLILSEGWVYEGYIS